MKHLVKNRLTRCQKPVGLVTRKEKDSMFGYPRLRSRIVAWVGLVLMVGLVAALATEWALPKAAAVPMSGGTPVNISLNPASVGHNAPVTVTVRLSAPVTNIGGQIVYLTYPMNTGQNAEWAKGTLVVGAPSQVTVAYNQQERDFQITTRTTDGWLGIMAKSSGGRVGNMLEIKD